MSTGVIDRMPSTGTRSTVTRELKAIDARIAILAAASRPSTSALGSASAKPFAWASASAVS